MRKSSKRKSQPSPKKPVITVQLSERPTLTVAEFCSWIGIGRSTCYKAIAAGDLKPSKYGKRTLIKQEEWKRFVRNMPAADTGEQHDAQGQ